MNNKRRSTIIIRQDQQQQQYHHYYRNHQRRKQQQQQQRDINNTRCYNFFHNFSKLITLLRIRQQRRNNSIMTSVGCFLLSFFIFICTTIGVVVWYTNTTTVTGTSEGGNSRGFHFKFYNPLSYKTIDSSSSSDSASSITGAKTLLSSNNKQPVIIENYYSNPNHSIWDGLLIQDDSSSSLLSSLDTSTAESTTTTTKQSSGGVYTRNDFKNDRNVIPPYWNCESSESTTDSISTSATNNNYVCNVTMKKTMNHGIAVGPCFTPRNAINWTEEIQKRANRTSNESLKLLYQKSEADLVLRMKIPITDKDWSNYCRPGFIIIGAGKCGTSSLYHYLTDHPRVLPAKDKQIHYFKYYTDRSLKWYYDHFPTTTSFLSSGALMTGEASPGYLPYPDVVYNLRSRISYSIRPNTNDQDNTNNENDTDNEDFWSLSGTYVGPKIITVGREPIDRAYSSYKYNYVTPALDMMRRGRYKHILKDQNDTYYEQYLFTFEEMILAELDVLNDCLSSENGSAVVEANKRWGKLKWIQHEFQRRADNNLPPLVALDEYCYGPIISTKIPRKQWKALVEQYPEKVIDARNAHLKQSLIGRGLYTLPLEWWYAVFPKTELFFICTEELSDISGDGLNALGSFLGLPSNVYNFSQSILKGAYNVAGYRGYDTEISWDEISSNKSSSAGTTTATHSANENPSLGNDKIPLSDATRKQLQEFINPYNERLFELVGRRCKW